MDIYYCVAFGVRKWQYKVNRKSQKGSSGTKDFEDISADAQGLMTLKFCIPEGLTDIKAIQDCNGGH